MTDDGTVLDLFCGAAGGWSLGLHRAGYRTVAACEIDPWRRSVFAANFPQVRMYDDVRRLDASRLLADLGELPRIVVGSPPCQDASSANLRGVGLAGERTGLFFQFIRLVNEIRPAWCAAENVSRLAHRGLHEILCSLEEIGYRTWPFAMGADDFGSPHDRERIWILAAHSDKGFQPGRPEHEEARGELVENPWRQPWAQAAPGFLGMADGLSPRLAGQCGRAYGDSVIPLIPEIIGRMMAA